MAGEDMNVEGAEGGTTSVESHVGVLRILLGTDRFALELGRVTGVVDEPTVTRVPRAPPVVAGITAIGGDVVPVIDCRTLLSVETPAADGGVVLVERAGGKRVGLLVDGVLGTASHHVDHIQPPAEVREWPPKPLPNVFLAVAEDDETLTGIFDVERLVVAAEQPT